MKLATRALLLSACSIAVTGSAGAADAPAVVSHVKVVSDKTHDVSSLDAWKRSFIREGMSDREKAMAVWHSVVAFRHQAPPPDEYLESMNNVHDPIKAFNVYGYNMCCCASANVQALARHAGLEARGWGIIAHSVPEVKWGGQWHMLDASLITYFPRPDGQPAGVAEIAQSVKAWLDANPKMKGNDDALRKFMRGGNWRTGPELLRDCPSYDDNGWLPAATHGWYATVQEYADPAKLFLYEYGTAVGYQVNVQLRKGERLTRNWSNKGLHVNMAEGKGLDVLKTKTGAGDLRYSPKYGDLAPGRVGNGVHEYDVPLTADLSRAALEFKNLVAQDSGLSTQDSTQPGVFVLDMPTSYVYLSGRAEVTTSVAAGGGVVVAVSGNNGLDWTDVATIAEGGTKSVDLKPHVYRRYAYRVRFTLTGQGTAVRSLKFVHDVQHSQRALPALDKGANAITFSAGPQEGTVTVFGSTNGKDAKGKNLLYTDFHPVANNIRGDMMFLAGGRGDITFPIATPGDMTRIRIGAHYRARDKRDLFEIAASFDDGKTWKAIGKLDGPHAGNSRSFTLADVPAGSRKALVQLTGVQYNTTGIHDLRIDADYAQPHGGFAPVKVTYVWDENGQEKRHEHVAKAASEAYTITCADKPLLKSLIVERAE